MKATLEGCYAKNAHALEQLKSLNKKIQKFVEGEPYELRVEIDRDTSIYRLRLIAKETPLAWSVVIGEILHDLRSVLDNLIWQLTIANGHEPPDDPLPRGSPWRNIAFPIFLEEGAFRSLRRDPLWGISNDARATVEEFQPFKGGSDRAHRDALWILNELSNIDKHRAIHLTASYLQWFRVEAGPFKGGGKLTPISYAPGPGIFKEETVLFEALLEPPNIKMNAKSEAQIDVAFDEGTAHVHGLLVRQTLTMMGAAVGSVLDEFKPHIP